MKQSSDRSKPSLFNCCKGWDFDDRDKMAPDNVQRFTPAANKYTLQMISPKASLKDIQAKRMLRSQIPDQSNCKHAQTLGASLRSPVHSTPRSNFSGFFKKQAKGQKKGSSLVLEPSQKWDQNQLQRPTNKDFLPEQPFFRRQDIKSSKRAQNNLMVQKPLETNRTGVLEKTTYQTESSSKHSLNSNSRIRKMSKNYGRPTPKNFQHLGIRLGNSRFTVLSEAELEQYEETPVQIRLQESTILVDVFNPTVTQLEQWSKTRPVGYEGQFHGSRF